MDPDLEPKRLKLIALDTDDLVVLSAYLQDAIGRVADIMYRPSEKRFIAVMNRFDWVAAGAANGAELRVRRQCALRFDRVMRVRHCNVQCGDPKVKAALLAMTFEEGEAPGGSVTLYFAGGGTLRLDVECIEAELRDLGPFWDADRMPYHGSAPDFTGSHRLSLSKTG